MKILIRVVIALLVYLLLDFVGSEILLTGLDKGFGLNQQSKIFVVGHSHMMMGIDRYELENGLHTKVSKYTRTGVSLPERYLMTGQYLRSGYADSLKVALVGVDCFTFVEGGISTNCYTLFYPFYGDSAVNHYLKDNAKPLEYWQHRIFRLSRYSDDLINSSFRGWMNDDKNYKTNEIDLDDFHKQRSKWKSDISFNPKLMSLLNKMITELNQKGVKVYLVNTPTLDEINRVDSAKFDSVMNYYRTLAQQNEMVDFLDFSHYEHDYSIFFDPLHLNVKGQKIVTDSLIEVLSKDSYLN